MQGRSERDAAGRTQNGRGRARFVHDRCADGNASADRLHGYGLRRAPVENVPDQRVLHP